MPRRSKIDQLDIGEKVIAYSLSGLTLEDISKKIMDEHSEKVSIDSVQKYLQKHQSAITERRTDSINKQIDLTLGFVQTTLLETVGEIRTYIEEFGENPKHAAAGLKLKLDAIEKMAKMLGGYPGDRQQTNVQVNIVNTQERFEQDMKDAEEYFRTVDDGPADA